MAGPRRRAGPPLERRRAPGGLPQCAADLELQALLCDGLVAGRDYTVTDGRQRTTANADTTGSVIASLDLRGGDRVSLSNGSRILTTLHVARLRVTIDGQE